MIPAISAQMMNGSGSAVPGWLPAGATAFLDFVNGNYYAGGAVQAIPTLLGGGFDAGEIYAGGMLVAYENANRPKAIGPLFSDLAAGLAAGCTIIFDVDHQNSPYGPYVMFLNQASMNPATAYVDFGAGYIEDAAALSLTFSLVSTGVHAVTGTLGRDNGVGAREYAASVDGGAFSTQTVAYAPFSPVDTILIGHDGDDSNVLDNVLIRSITLYPAQVTPLAVAGAPSPDAMVGLGYTAQVSATGGTLPYIFSIASGTLPDGLSLNSATGEISGTPTGTGVAAGIVVRVTDADSTTADLAAFDLTVRNSLARLVDQRNHMGAATFTLSGVNFGPADASRIIAVVATGAGASHETSGMTIASVAASLGAKTTNGRSAAIYFAAVPTGASGDIDVTISTINIFVQFAVFALYGVAPSVFDSDSLVDASGTATNFAGSVDADDNGIVLAGFCASVKTVSVAWSGLTEVTDFDPNGAANQRHSTACLMNGAAAPVSVTATTSGTTGGALAVVSFTGA